MAIDGIDKAGMADLIRRATQEQETQDAKNGVQKDTAQLEQERAKEQGAAGQGLGPTQTDQNLATEVRPDQIVGEVEEGKKTGVQMHDESVEVANVQQDRGENWQDFSANQQERVLPPSVEEQARDAEEAADKKEQEERVNVADLMKQMAIQSGKISS